MGGQRNESQATGAQSHDPDYPEKFLKFMRTGWRDSDLSVARRPEADRYAARRAALSAAFPGETLIIPSGQEVVRANDCAYRFRPGSDFVYLTGEHDPDAVLVMHASGEAELYVRPRSPRSTDEFFRDRSYGELWIGRRHTLAEKSIELGIDTVSLAELPAVLDGCAPGRTRVLRGYDSGVDTAVRGHAGRDAELAQYLSEARLVKDAWEVDVLQAAIDATVRGFEDVARVLPADRPVPERLIEGVFGFRISPDGARVLFTYARMHGDLYDAGLLNLKSGEYKTLDQQIRMPPYLLTDDGARVAYIIAEPKREGVYVAEKVP